MTINTEHIGLKYDAFRDDVSLLACHVKNDVEALVAEVERVRELARVADRRAYRAEQLLQQERKRGYPVAQPSESRIAQAEKISQMSLEDRRLLGLPVDAFEAISWLDLPNARKIVDPPMVNDLNWRDGQMFDDKGRPLVTLLRTRYQDLAYAAETLLAQRDAAVEREKDEARRAGAAEKEVERLTKALAATESYAVSLEISGRISAETANGFRVDRDLARHDRGVAEANAVRLKDALAAMSRTADEWMVRSEENYAARVEAEARINGLEAKVAKWKRRAQSRLKTIDGAHEICDLIVGIIESKHYENNESALSARILEVLTP